MAFLVALGTAFLLVVPVELPDKTFVATLVLATRYRPGPVWIGVTLAFGIQGLVAQGRHPVGVFAGSWAGLAMISAAAVVLGRVLLRYVSMTLVQYIGAVG